MKFRADMGISPKTVACLHTLGHDAVHLSNQGLKQLPAPDIVAKARHEGRMLLVHDLGFLAGATTSSSTTAKHIHSLTYNRYQHPYDAGKKS